MPLNSTRGAASARYSPPEGNPGGDGTGGGVGGTAGGGGGAGGAGTIGSSVPTTGGVGIQSDITGSNIYYGGGGCGDQNPSPNTNRGGLGGGGGQPGSSPGDPNWSGGPSGSPGFGGGGAGIPHSFGGGGAGGLRTITTYTSPVTATTYPVSIGAGQTSGPRLQAVGGDGVVIIAYRYKGRP
jgi:hypothetical protein